MLSEEFFERAKAAGSTAAEHTKLRHDSGLFDVVEVRQPLSGSSKALRGSLRIGAWNLERCKYIEATAARLMSARCDVVLLSEMDNGMARSGNLHTTRELADRLGFGYAFCVEFIEIGMGNQTESLQFADERNSRGLHGNAILSRYPISSAHAVSSPRDGAWYALDWHHRRVGGRRALAATIELPIHAATVASVHLESLSSADQRAAEVTAMLDAWRPYDLLPDVIGGDFNTHDAPLPDGSNRGLGRIEAEEPLFGVLRRHGYEWSAANTDEATRRTLANGLPKAPHRRYDWFFARRVGATGSRVLPAVNSVGFAISDHELIISDLDISARTKQ